MKKFLFKSLTFLVTILLTFQLGSAYGLSGNDILPPSNLTSQLITPSDVKLTWDSVYGATGYNVYGISDGQLKLLNTTTSTSYTFNDLAEGSYTYVVSTLSGYGESGPGAPITVNITYPNMNSPTNLTSTIQNGNDVVLNWTASQYAKTYNLYKITPDGQKSLVTTVSKPTYSIINAPAGSFTYAVSAAHPLYGESPLSTSTQLDVVWPTMVAPGNLTYSILNGNDISLKWNPVNYATGYKVYQIIDGQKVLKSTLPGTTVTYTNMPDGDYSYEIHSYSDRFGESQDGSQATLTLVLPVMQSPGTVNYTITNGNDITLKWDAVPYAKGYKVYQIVDGQKVLKSTLPGTTVTYTNMPGGDYSYEIHSYSDRFGESQDGSQTTFTLVLPEMQSPATANYAITNGNDITLNWDAVPYANSYKVYQIVDGQKVLKSTLTGTTVRYTNMPGGDYSYEIHSYSNRFGESADGNVISFSLVLPIMQSPANVVQTIKSATSFTLSWNATPYATSYKVYQIIDGVKILKSTVTGTTVSYTNMASGDYNFEIHSYSTRFGESVDGSNITVTLNGQIMQAPTNLTYNITNGNDITLKWTAAPYATSYKIYQVIDGQPVLQKTVTGTYVTFANMPAGDYDYIVDSVSTVLGESPNGAEINFPLVFPTMSAPTNLMYYLRNGNDVVLTWSPVAYANKYNVYELIDGQLILKTTVSYTTATLTNTLEGEHTYIVKSVSTRFGESEYGNQVSLSLVYPTMQAPNNFTYSIANGNDITLKWNASSYATTYKVYQIIDGQKILKQTVTGTSVRFVNMPEGDYNYEIHSYSNRFGESLDGSQTSFSLVFPTMQAPNTFTYSIVNGNDIILKWNASSYATSYKVYQIIDGQKILKQTVTDTDAAFVNMPEGDYIYEIHSYSSRFGESSDGSQTSLSLVFPTMQAPNNFTYSIANGNDIILKWNASSYATAYRVYQIIDGQKILKQTVTGTSVRFINMPEGDYEYEVNSYSSRFGESPVSNKLSLSLIWPVVQPPALKSTISNINNITLSWQAVTWANEYRLYEVTDGTKQLLYKGKSLSYKIYNLSEGTHSYQATAYSTRFGESQLSEPQTLTIIYPDMQAPVATLKLIDQTTAQISWNFVTYANGYNVYEIIDNKPVLIVENLNNLSYTINNLSYKNHEYYVTSYSNSFGESDPSNIVLAKLIVDTEPPVTSADAPVNWTTQSPILVNLSASDKDTGVAATYYSIDDSAFLEGTSFIITEEGIHKVSFYSVDKAGNIESVKTIYIKIDKTAPITTSNIPTNWSKDEVTINLTAADLLSGVAKTFYSVDDSSYFEGTSFTIQTEGIHKVSFYSVDVAGNTESTNTTYVKIDKTAPAITTDLNSEYKLGNLLPLNYKTTDNLSGVAVEEMVVMGPNDNTGTVYKNGANLELNKPGVYTVNITVADAAGNTTTIKKQLVVYIPANIQVTAKVINDNNGLITVRVDLPSGYDTQALDLNTATLNGVNALTSNNGYYNQAKIGQFKFRRSDFNWTYPEIAVEFRCYLNGNLVIGQTTVKVQK